LFDEAIISTKYLFSFFVIKWVIKLAHTCWIWMRVQMGIMTLAGPFQLNYNHPLKKTLCFTTLNSFYSFLCVKLLWLYRNQIDVYSELLGNKNMLYWPSKLLFSNTKMSSNICFILAYGCFLRVNVLYSIGISL
jgi:hypothetical protein